MLAIVCAILAGVCWGVGELCTKAVMHSGQVGPMGVLLVRTVAVVPLVVLAFAAAAYGFKTEPAAWWKAESATLWKLFLGSALAAGFGGVLFFYLGLSLGEISVVKPIAFTIAPAAAAVLGWLVLKEAMTAQKVVGIVLVLTGLVVLTAKLPSSASAAAPEPPMAKGP